MKKLILSFAASLLLTGIVLLSPGRAQTSNAVVVSSCGTPPSTYTAGANRQITQDTTGTLCTATGGGGGGSVTQGTVPWVTAAQATAANTNAIAPVVSAAAESDHVLKASAGNLYSVYVTTGATAGYLLIFNATSAPVDGAVTPIHCVQAPANSTVGMTFGAGPPESYATGITASFSSTGCFTKTASATAFFHGSVK